MDGFRSGRAEATARKISSPALGTTWDTATATFRYSFGTARQTAATILPAWEGAAAAAALAMALACLGCSAAAAPAATDAISGTARATAPTMAEAAAGFIPTAHLTALRVASCRSRALVRKTKSAALAGSSTAGAADKVSLKGLAFGASFPKELQAVRKATLSAIFTIVFIDLLPELYTKSVRRHS